MKVFYILKVPINRAKYPTVNTDANIFEIMNNDV